MSIVYLFAILRLRVDYTRNYDPEFSYVIRRVIILEDAIILKDTEQDCAFADSSITL